MSTYDAVATKNETTAVPVFHPCRWGEHIFTLSPLPQEIRGQMEQDIKELKELIKMELLESSNKPKEQLELIDTIERLGVAYHFEEEIEEALQQLHAIHHDQDDLYYISLRFRILRQHGFHASSDVFKKSKDDEGGFKGELRDILSLYEASHVRIHEETILDEAAEFTTTYLKSMVTKLISPLAEQVAHALHQPLHKGITAIEARYHTCSYEQEPSHSTTLLRFAKLDFNLQQSLHQQELIDVARWWKRIHAKIPYARDRSIEAYFWALGTYYEPQYSSARVILAKMILIIQMMDDTYDAYGTFESLDLLTQAINRWEYSCICDLPEDIRCSYQAVLETFDDFEQQLAKQGRSFSVDYARKQMKRNTKAWFQEAKWCHEKYIPTYDEHLKIALESMGHVVGVVGSYLGMRKTANEEAFEWVSQNPMPKPVKASAIIFRLMNDVGGHKYEQSSRDHVASSVECYMKQHDIKDEKQAYEVLEKQVEDAWKDVNQALLQPYEVPKPCLDRPLNFARMANVMYKDRNDGYTHVTNTIMHKVVSVLVHPIP
ncbi:hypothetical protein Cgig2_023412 [Carnegiea gigantea]|uniref:Uncharacterized protein n=1 Tax=Carnegiea gigantea TaxID=171969 RepID=A0A9Q1K413_9CARY|nr:hypothetical protein Cgig2_023412 [Carnegiea gigantea]